MNGAMKAAWGLTGFVVVGGLVLWLVTGRTVFAVFVVLGLLTGIGAWLLGRTAAAPGRTADAPGRTADAPGRTADPPGRTASSKEDTTP